MKGKLRILVVFLSNFWLYPSSQLLIMTVLSHQGEERLNRCDRRRPLDLRLLNL